MLNTKSIHTMFNLMRPCFLQPKSFSALFSRGLSLASLLHRRWSSETDTVSGETVGELRPGMALGMVFYQPSVNLQCVGDSSLWACWQVQEVNGCGGFWSPHPGAVLDRELHCQRKKWMCYSFHQVSSAVIFDSDYLNTHKPLESEFQLELKLNTSAKIIW